MPQAFTDEGFLPTKNLALKGKVITTSASVLFLSSLDDILSPSPECRVIFIKYSVNERNKKTEKERGRGGDSV